MDLPRKRLLLRPDAGRQDFLDYASRRGLTFHEEFPEDRDRLVPYGLLYSTPDGQTWVNYVDDYLMKLRYVVISGRDVDGVAREAADELDLLPDEAVLSALDYAEEPRDAVAAVRMVAVAAPQRHDARFMAEMEKGLRHPVPSVRLAAVRASAYPTWPELRPLLEALRDGDPDPRVRADAAQMLGVFDDFGV